MKKSYGKIDAPVYEDGVRVSGTTINEIFNTISKKNQDYITEFLAWKTGSITPKRLLMIKNSLIKFADLLEMDFEECSKTQITIAWNIIYACELSIKSKQDDFMHIRQTFKHWFGDDEEIPKVCRGMKRPTQKGHLRLPKKMPTEADILDMIKKCRNSRDKFWVAWTGLDSAVRPCENRALRWRDLSKDEHGYFFTIKTGKESGDTENRSIRVINSEPYLLDWMKDYPSERKDEYFVFSQLNNGGIPLGEGAISSMFKKLKKRVKFKGKFSAYTLRHVCLTRLSKNPKVAIPLLKKMAGHSRNSNVIAEYQHFGDEDVLEMNLAVSGKKELKKDYELKNKPIRCPHCSTSNPYDSEVCGKCNFALSQERMVNTFELEKEIKSMKKTLNDFVGGKISHVDGRFYTPEQIIQLSKTLKSD